MKFAITILVSLFAAGVSCQEPNLFSSHSDWNKGFESLRIGMTVAELLALRPDAKVSEFDKADMRADDPRVVDLDRSEYIKNVPAEGVNLVARYTITDQKLEEIIFIWVGPFEVIKTLRASFVRFCMDNFGKDFQPVAMEQNANGPERHIAPLMCWNVGRLSVSASCTPDTEGMPLEHGALSLAAEPENEKAFPHIAKQKSAEKGIDDAARRRVFQAAGIDIPPTK